MSKSDLWTRAADAMRKDDDTRWHKVADWLRGEAALHDEMEPFAELLNCAIEQASGVKSYIRFGRDEKGDPSMMLDTSEPATAVALAYLTPAEPHARIADTAEQEEA